MNKQILLQNRRLRAKNRVRSTISGTSKRPRLNVSLSLVNVTAQLIDDTKGVTLVSATSIGKKEMQGKNLTEKAQQVAELIAAGAKSKKITEVVFDRGPRSYHGRVKTFAETARKNGLKF